MQDLVLGLIKLHFIGLCPSIQPFQVSLQTPPTFQQIDTCSQLTVICKFTNERLNTFIHVINKNIEQDWPQHRLLRDTTSDWPSTGCSTIHHHSLGLAIQTVLNPAKSAPVKAVGCQLFQEYAVGDSVQGLAEVQIDNIHSLSYIHQEGHLVIKGDQVGQTRPTPTKPMLAGSDTLTILQGLHDNIQYKLFHYLTGRHFGQLPVIWNLTSEPGLLVDMKKESSEVLEDPRPQITIGSRGTCEAREEHVKIRIEKSPKDIVELDEHRWGTTEVGTAHVDKNNEVLEDPRLQITIGPRDKELTQKLEPCQMTKSMSDDQVTAGDCLGNISTELRPVPEGSGLSFQALDTAAKGWPGCLRAVAAVAINIQEARKFTLGQKMTVLVSHTMSAVLEAKGGHWLSPQRFLKYQAILVEQDDVEIVVTNIVNPASFLSWSMGEPVIHDCLKTIESTYSSRPDLKDTPLEDAETWFTDGSSYVISGRRHAGCAVTTSKEVIESGPLTATWTQGMHSEWFMLTEPSGRKEDC
ncbi:hypothetical protein DUI87_13460 [Hirundo rustica rustica]|uniref:Uncharacterized protein n=1 Tax=Hirundo rustica rustica TaxID=333673 RepID=A0A3M0KEN1_HIRRU|nr:hypothetical protein DUI87_13460 [Hirundo rustica rustica]